MTDIEMNGHKADAEITEADELAAVPRDTSYEHALDETAPDPEPVHDGGGIEIPRLGGERRDIIPAHLRTWKGIRSTAYRHFDAARFHVVFHLLRSPGYLASSVLWSVAGFIKLARNQLHWWWVIERPGCGPRPSWTATAPNGGPCTPTSSSGGRSAARCCSPRCSRSRWRSC